jgi:predicted nucleic acid-binding protein
MSGTVLLDTGPWVALLCRNDSQHRWASGQFSTLTNAPLTCEAVVSETCFLLARNGFDPSYPLKMIEDGLIRVSFTLADQVADVRALFERYDNVPASFADACLIRMAEVHTSSKVLTLDRDFSIYKKSRKRAVPLIAPWA